MRVKFYCTICKSNTEQESRYITRAKKLGSPIYCGRVCAGIARRKNYTEKQKKMNKRLYDMEYRTKNRQMLKEKKAVFFQKTYDPAEAAKYRKSRMHLHIQYCQNPEYRKYKKSYDQQYLAKKHYGEFWEVAIIANNLENECLSRMSRYEMDLMNGKLCKNMNRRRQDERVNRRKFEERALGNAKPDQRQHHAAIAG